jgi:agmatinase
MLSAGIRAGSRRLTLYGGYNVPLEANPFRSGLRIVDCGDIPVTSVDSLSERFHTPDRLFSPYDNKYAIQQIEDGHKSLLQRTAFSPLGNDSLTGDPLLPISLDGKNHPRIITLGGDHTIVLPLLRSIHSGEPTSSFGYFSCLTDASVRPHQRHPFRFAPWYKILCHHTVSY